jgi:Leucine-rich repeat (LRR) protein
MRILLVKDDCFIEFTIVKDKIISSTMYDVNVLEFFEFNFENIVELGYQNNLINLNYVTDYSLEASFNRSKAYVLNKAIELKDFKLISLLEEKKINAIDVVFDWVNSIGVHFESKEALMDAKVIEFDALDIKSLPKEFSVLKNLESLSMWGCGLSVFPDEILELEGLKKLNLFGNELAFIPPLSVMKNLEELNISNNEKINNIDFLQECYNIKTLKMNGINKVHDFEPLCDLNKLESLHISGCDLDKMPDAVFTLFSLIEIVANHNNIKTIPSKLFETFMSIKILELTKNQLTAINNIVYRSELAILNISYNPIENIDSKRMGSSNLKSVDMEGIKYKFTTNDYLYLEKIHQCKF